MTDQPQARPAQARDVWDEEAEKALPCEEDCVDVADPIPCHTETCPAFYRPAVAALARRAYKAGVEFMHERPLEALEFLSEEEP